MGGCDQILYSDKGMFGQNCVVGRRTAGHLDSTKERLAEEHPRCRLVIIQPAYNTGVAASAGTHDFDACLDVSIEGMGWWAAQSFFVNAAGRPGTGIRHSSATTYTWFPWHVPARWASLCRGRLPTTARILRATAWRDTRSTTPGTRQTSRRPYSTLTGGRSKQETKCDRMTGNGCTTSKNTTPKG